MKKMQFTSCFLSLSLFLQPLLAEDILESSNEQTEVKEKAKEIIKQMQEKQEAKKQGSQDSKIHKENLQHLFDTKFPVDDYIYKAGKRVPNENESMQKILSLIDDENAKEQAKEQINTQETKAQEQSDEEKAQEQLAKTKEQKEKLKAQNQQIAKEVQLTEEQKLKALLRASILSERNSEINAFNKKF